MFRGTSSFHHSADDDVSAPPMPKGLVKKKQSSSKNPYSSRGLDKFSDVLSELEARREKIMEKSGTKGPAMVRFMYSESSSQDWIPIVVRLPPEETTIHSSPKKPDPTQPKPKDPSPSAQKAVKKSVSWGEGKRSEEQPGLTQPMHPSPPAQKAVKKRLEDQWWRWKPSGRMLAVMLLMLVSLVMFGRVFAICCTSIWWYMLPILNGDEGRNTKRRSSMKNEYGRRPSDKSLPAVADSAGTATWSKKMGGGGGPQELASPRAKF